jgi:uncharacterized membrane protein YheB (UPF0754 family)
MKKKRGSAMNVQPTVESHINITDTLSRLYLFLAQSLDRCVSEAARISYPEPQFQATLASTKATVLDMLSVNQVVKDKVAQECDRIESLVTACLKDGAAKAGVLDELKAERAVLKHKTLALSDLLAVFRAA